MAFARPRVILFVVPLLSVLWGAGAGATLPVALDAVADDEYEIYNRVVEAKFLTDQSRLVLIRRHTVAHLGPDGVPVNRRFFEAQDLFEGRLPGRLLQDFLLVVGRPSELEPRFTFGVRFRLVSDFEEGVAEETAGALESAWARLLQGAPPVLMLEFSRIGFTPRHDQALVYVGEYRRDGTGAGFLVWLRRASERWDIAETEIAWTAQLEERR